MAESANKSFMGIDFGTTSCKFGYFINGKVEIFEDEFGNKSMPSYVAFTKDGRLVGEKAKRQMGENPRNTVFAVKKLMGKSFEDAVALYLQFPFQLIKMDHELCGVEVENESQKLKLYPEQVAAMLFSKMKYLAEKQLELPVNAAVISVPPGFNSCQRQATVNAGTIAGFNDVRLVDDSTALATAISYHGMVGRETENVAVVDFGGGFTSASMITTKKTSFKELPSVTLEFGGIDIDESIRDILENKLVNQNDSINDSESLRISAENAKIHLPFQEEFFFHKNEKIYLSLNEVYYNLNVGHKIVRMIKNLKSFTPGLCTNRHIDQVIMTGEFTKSPFVKYQLTKLFEDKEIRKFGEFPDGVITGAVLESAVQRGLVNSKWSDYILNRTVELNGDILFQNDRNPMEGITKNVSRGMILTEYSGPNQTPIPTAKKKFGSWWMSSSEYIHVDYNKIIHTSSSYNQDLLCFRLPGEHLNEIKSLENILRDKEKKYEDERKNKLAVISKKQSECFDSFDEAFINDNMEEIHKMVTNSSISENSDLEELEEEINRLSSVQEEVVKKYSVYLINPDNLSGGNDTNEVVLPSTSLSKSQNESNEFYSFVGGSGEPLIGSGSSDIQVLHVTADKETERERAAEEMERKRAAEEIERKRADEEMERKRVVEEMERKRAVDDMEKKRAAEEMERKRAFEEKKRKRAAEDMARKAALQNERNKIYNGRERKRADEEMERKRDPEEMGRKRDDEKMERKGDSKQMGKERDDEELERKRDDEKLERKRDDEEMERKGNPQEMGRENAEKEMERKRAFEERKRKRAAEEMARKAALEKERNTIYMSKTTHQ